MLFQIVALCDTTCVIKQWMNIASIAIAKTFEDKFILGFETLSSLLRGSFPGDGWSPPWFLSGIP